jgi:nanoRNase/pAp phosphatase (c-di-AMP/oligoRNAs hydrolase)
MKNYQVQNIKSLLSNAKTASVVIPHLSIDSIAAGLALVLALKKNNIEATGYCPQKTDANYSKLSGLEYLLDTYNQHDLVISLDYSSDQIEKVSYNNDDGRLNLVVQTKNNAPKIEKNQININNQSSVADINFILGDESLLGTNSSLVENGDWIYISSTNNPKSWAKATVVDQDAPYCEMFTFLLPNLGLKLDPDSAKNLLIGLRVATQSFSINVSPETFEAGAICLKATQQPVQSNNLNSNGPIVQDNQPSAPQNQVNPSTDSIPTA